MGGKTRLAGDIRNLAMQYKGDRTVYIEPFMGSAVVTARIAPEFTVSMAGDACKDLVLLWQAASAGWVPPDVITREEYEQLRASPPSALRGYAGFQCSFGAMWFSAYAQDNHGRNYAKNGIRSIVRTGSALKNTSIMHRSFWDWDNDITGDAVVYCDPPYRGTTGYPAVGAFDSDRFWKTATEWSHRGAAVLVSEYNAPAGWDVAFEATQTRCIGNKGKKTTEKVFIHA